MDWTSSQVQDSLTKLQTNYIDLLYLHLYAPGLVISLTRG